MEGVGIVGKWSHCVTPAKFPARNSKNRSCYCSLSSTVNLRTDLAAYRPQFRLFSRRRLRASNSVEPGIFLPHLVASLVRSLSKALLFKIVRLLCFSKYA